MERPAPARGTDRKLLVFRFGAQAYAADVSAAREVVRDLTPVPLPGSPRYIAGIVSLRGTTIKVIDLARLLDACRGEVGDHSRILILDAAITGGETYGLFITEVYGVVGVLEQDIRWYERSSRFVANDYMIARFTLTGEISEKYRQKNDELLVIWIDLCAMVNDMLRICDQDEVELRLVRLFDPYQIVRFTKVKRQR